MGKYAVIRDQKREALVKLHAGYSVKDVSREHGVSPRTVYRWRANVVLKQKLAEEGGERLRVLEVAHRQLQQRFAELALDYAMLRAALIKDVKGDC